MFELLSNCGTFELLIADEEDTIAAPMETPIPRVRIPSNPWGAAIDGPKPFGISQPHQSYAEQIFGR